MKKDAVIRIRCTTTTFIEFWGVAGKHHFRTAEDAIKYFVKNFEALSKMVPYQEIRRKNL